MFKSLQLCSIGFALQLNNVVHIFVTIVSTMIYSLPGLMTVSIHICYPIWIQKYNNKCSVWTSWFDLARSPCILFKPKSFNNFKSIDWILRKQEESLQQEYWEQSDIPSSWMLYFTVAIREDSGHGNNHSLHLKHETKYLVSPFGGVIRCDLDNPWDCE